MEVAKSNRYVDNAGYESKIINAALGVGAALILPRCNTAAMILHLQEISVAVAPGAALSR
jgi:hypothetical protein